MGEGVISREQQVERVREVRRKLAEEGPPWTRDREGDFERISVPQRDCDLVRDVLIGEGVGSIVEVGLAYASSALAIGEALLAGGAEEPRHVVIDPFQATEWSYAGWDLIRSAGLDSTTTLIIEPSSMALPHLVTEKVTADAAFVDGSHRFHEVFIDLYFLRKIVRPGGVVILDDHWWPSVHTAETYYETNMGWQPIPNAFDGGTVREATGRHRTQAFRLPDPPFEPAFDQFKPFS